MLHGLCTTAIVIFLLWAAIAIATTVVYLIKVVATPIWKWWDEGFK